MGIAIGESPSRAFDRAAMPPAGVDALPASVAKLCANAADALLSHLAPSENAGNLPAFKAGLRDFIERARTLSYADSRTVSGVLCALRDLSDTKAREELISSQIQHASPGARLQLSAVQSLLFSPGADKDLSHTLVLINRLVVPGINLKDPSNQLAAFSAPTHLTIGLNTGTPDIPVMLGFPRIKIAPSGDRMSVTVHDSEGFHHKVWLGNGGAMLVGRRIEDIKIGGENVQLGVEVEAWSANTYMSRGAILLSYEGDQLRIFDRTSRSRLMVEHATEGLLTYDSISIVEGGEMRFGKSQVR